MDWIIRYFFSRDKVVDKKIAVYGEKRIVNKHISIEEEIADKSRKILDEIFNKKLK